MKRLVTCITTRTLPIVTFRYFSLLFVTHPSCITTRRLAPHNEDIALLYSKIQRLAGTWAADLVPRLDGLLYGDDREDGGGAEGGVDRDGGVWGKLQGEAGEEGGEDGSAGEAWESGRSVGGVARGGVPGGEGGEVWYEDEEEVVWREPVAQVFPFFWSLQRAIVCHDTVTMTTPAHRRDVSVAWICLDVLRRCVIVILLC